MDKLKEHTSDELIAKLQRETGFSQGRILIKTAREILGERDYRELLANEGTEARAVEKGGYLYIFSKLEKKIDATQEALRPPTQGELKTMRRVRKEFDNLIKIVDTMYAQKKLSLDTDYQRKIGQKLREVARRNVLTSSPAARELSELELERIKILYRYYLEQLIRLYKESGKDWSPNFQKIAFNAVTEIIDNESSKLLTPKGVLGSAEPILNEIVKTEVFKFKSDIKLELDKYKGLRQLELQTVPKELGGLKNDTNRVDTIIAKIKNNPVIAILIVIFFIVIGIATFTESVDKIVKFARTYLPITATDRTPKVVTISSGEITLSGQGFYLIDTEGGTESDELIRINGLKKGDEVTLNAASDDRTIVVKEGHYLIMQRPVFSLDNENDFIIFRSKGGDICVEVDRKSLGD